jgi:hypothetical protein
VSRIAVLILLLGACTEPRSKRCQQVCAKEAECHDKVESPDNFDEGECLDACAALERDVEAEPSVAHHAECVKIAQTCEAVIACP